MWRPDGMRPIGIPRVGWEVNIKMVPQEMERWACTRFIWLRIGQVERSCEYGNEPLGSIKCGEFLD